MDKQAEEILTGINKPVAADATGVSIGNEAPDETSRFNAMEKAGVLQAAALLAAPLFGKKVKKQGGVNVFSGFDGASGAQTGLRKAGVPINKYYASEIDKDAIDFTQHNYPETIQLGDIRNVDLNKLEPMDYGFFGFPCQTLSSANHNGNIGLRDMTTGKVLATLNAYEAAKAAGHELSSSSLFYEALKQAMVLKKRNPDVRLVFENVASMKPEFRDIIDVNLKYYLDLDPSFEMNTKGPTNRQRLLWTNAITRDDYNALSERMKQVMPDDIIDQKARHELSAKGAKDNQADLFENNGGEVPADGKFEAKTNKWLKGKFSTATASGGAGTLMKNGLEYNMTKKEMNRSQGNPDNLGLDYGLSDRQFAKLIGNGWDQFQFKPIFDRFAMEAAGKIPKSEGRLGDENAIMRINEKYQPDGERKHISPRLYHSRTLIPDRISLDPPLSRWDVGTGRVDIQDIPRHILSDADMTNLNGTLNRIFNTTPIGQVGNKIDQYIRGTTYLDNIALKVKRLIKTAPPGLSGDELNQYLEANLSPIDMQRLERLKEYKYDNFRPGIWLATGKKRLGTYGDFNYRIDIPPRDFERMLNEGTASVRPSSGDDAVVNIFEPIPTNRITRAKLGDRRLGDTTEPVDNLNIPMFERLANRWNLDTGTLHTIDDRKPVGMPLSTYLNQIVKLKPSEKRALFRDDPYIANQLILKYPTSTLRTAFDKLETPMGIVPLKNATGYLRTALNNISRSGDRLTDVKILLANIAAGFVKPADVVRDLGPLVRLVFEPLHIDLNTLYE